MAALWCRLLPFFILLNGCNAGDSPGVNQAPDGLFVLVNPWDGDGQTNSETPLVNGGDWVLVPTEVDPFMSDTVRDDVCDETAYGPEYDGVEVRTGSCGYITLSQPIKHQISQGSLIHIIAWHSSLFSPVATAAKGVMTIRFGDSLLWSVNSPIPSTARSFDLIFESPRRVDRGSPVYLNISNHGSNAWNVLALRILDESMNSLRAPN